MFKIEGSSEAGPEQPLNNFKVNVNEQRLTVHCVSFKRDIPCSSDLHHAACRYGEAVAIDNACVSAFPYASEPRQGWVDKVGDITSTLNHSLNKLNVNHFRTARYFRASVGGP